MSLCLSRKRGQVVRLHTSDGVIRILVSEFTHGQVRLKFDAPSSVKIHRDELPVAAAAASGSAESQQ